MAAWLHPVGQGPAPQAPTGVPHAICGPGRRSPLPLLPDPLQPSLSDSKALYNSDDDSGSDEALYGMASTMDV